MALSVQKIRASLENGLLSFPVTDMDDTGAFHPKNYEERLDWFTSYDVSAVFVAGGTGEFFSLSKREYQELVTTAVQTVQEKVPVISSIGRSIPEAIEWAKIAEKAGINALLLMPPYLVGGPSDGLVHYAKTIMQHTDLPVIYYNRSNGILSADYLQELANTCSNFIGLKDGTSDMQDLNTIINKIGNRLSYIGGAPTAEIISEAYLSIGVNTYSSAVFNFVPTLASHFYKSLREGEKETVQSLLKAFYIPFVELRDRKKGYAVSLVKAGAQLIGRSAGKVRAPLSMPNFKEMTELELIIKNGLDAIDSSITDL